MSSLARLAAFAVLLVGVFGGAALAGGAIDPDTESEAEAGHESSADDHASEAAAGDEHGGGEEAPAGAALPGLAVAEGGYRLVAERTRYAAGDTPERFAFRVPDARGKAVRSFETEHDKKMHLIVVRRDFAGFQHLHPEMRPDGTWAVDVDLGEPGTYRAFADFKVEGDKHTLGVDVHAAGTLRPQPLPPAADVARTESGYEVALDAPTPESGAEQELRFEVRRDGRTVTDVEPYLGARGHLVALRQGDLAYLHVHPEDAATAGDAITFMAEYPSPGAYRLFLQFKHEGRVHTAAFTQEVAR